MRNAAPAAPSKMINFADFSGGMNTQGDRHGLPQNQLAWCENLQIIAPNKLLGVPGPGAALASLPGETIIKQFYFNLGPTTNYIVCFCASGAAYAVRDTGTVTKFAPAGTFSNQPPDCTELSTQRMLIADAKAGYCTWDGSVFAMKGTVSPNIIVTAGGSGYISPIAARTGGSGSGDTYSVQMVGGVVTGVTLLTPGSGFLATDVLTLTITDGGGVGSGATANAHVWPFVSPAPTTLAVAFSRVWLAQGNVLIVTGTGSSTFGSFYDDFATGDASVTTTITDTDLVHEIVGLRYLEGYLYILGDGSVKFVSGITVSSGVTNFTITPLTSDQGTTFRDSIVSFNRLVLFANQVGVYAVFGASVEKISDAMDGVFQKIDFSQPISAALVDLNNIRLVLFLARYVDPVEAITRSVLIAYSGKVWFLIAQGDSVAFVVSSILNGERVTYATSGSDVTELLADEASAVDFLLQTSLWHAGDITVGKRVVRAGAAHIGGLPATFTIESELNEDSFALTGRPVAWVNSGGVTIEWENSSGDVITWAGNGFYLDYTASISCSGIWIGASIAGAANGCVFNSIDIEYQIAAQWFNQAAT